MEVASRTYCEELYILTNCGHKFETLLYYDQFGRILTRQEVMNHSKRTLPMEYTPAYTLGYMRKIAMKIKGIDRMKLKLKTALYYGEDEMAKFLIQMAKENHLKK